MGIKVYISSISGNMEMKKSQQYVSQIMTSKKIDFEEIDIADPSNEEEKQKMFNSVPVKEGQRRPVPPQIFNGDVYCGDYEAFSEAVETEELEVFLKL